ncbi:MAG: SiaB family protein kinase [Oscillospiraceae bacterium]|nr:SiaB family protein kinase [Oscillospiraceae bacterium]
MILDMLEYYNMISKLNINIIYSGPLWADGIEGIADTVRKCLEFDELTTNVSHSVFSVFVEQMNNMLMYSQEKMQVEISSRLTDVPKGAFVLGSRDKTYFLQSGNVMNNSSIEFLKERIDYINTLDKKDLRKYYREMIKADNTNPESKGGGIGLIEIAKRATSKIEYSFVPFEEDKSFFSMFVTISRGE